MPLELSCYSPKIGLEMILINCMGVFNQANLNGSMTLLFTNFQF